MKTTKKITGVFAFVLFLFGSTAIKAQCGVYSIVNNFTCSINVTVNVFDPSGTSICNTISTAISGSSSYNIPCGSCSSTPFNISVLIIDIGGQTINATIDFTTISPGISIPPRFCGGGGTAVYDSSTLEFDLN